MDIVSLTIGLPFAPLRGLLALARVLQQEAEEQLYSPAAIRRELEEIEALPDESARARQQQVVDRLLRR